MIVDIYDGKMDWSLADSFENHTLYQVQRETVLENITAAFDLHRFPRPRQKGAPYGASFWFASQIAAIISF